MNFPSKHSYPTNHQYFHSNSWARCAKCFAVENCNFILPAIASNHRNENHQTSLSLNTLTIPKEEINRVSERQKTHHIPNRIQHRMRLPHWAFHILFPFGLLRYFFFVRLTAHSSFFKCMHWIGFGGKIYKKKCRGKKAVHWAKGMCLSRIIPVRWTQQVKERFTKESQRRKREKKNKRQSINEKKVNSISPKLWIKSTLSRFTEYPPEILKPTN